MWKRFETREEAQALGDQAVDDREADFCQVYWAGPGWYYCANEARRCPGGCCTETWHVARPAASIAEQASQRMRLLAETLREARDYERME